MQEQAITAPTAATLGFCARAALHPERVAVVNPDTTTVSYGELLRQVNQLSHGLRALGLGRESTVCLATRNHYVYFAAALACEQIGVYLVPVNWHLTAAETQYIVKNSQAELAIVGDGLEAMMTAALDEAGLQADRRFSVNGAAGMRPLSDITDGRSDALPEGRMAASQMLYTSGTTGVPKGVRRPVFDMEPEQLLAVLRPMFDERGMGPGDGVFFGPAPLYHAAPGFHALWALHAGYEVVLMDHWDSEAALAAIERHRVTHTHLAPIHIQRWLALPDQVRTRYDVSSLRRVIHAGAPCPVEVKRKAIEWIGPVLFEYYAGSEGGFTSVTCEEWLEHPGTVGNVGAGSAEIRVVDEETGGALPPGGIGLVYAKVMLPFEYHRDAEKTAATQTTDGFFTLGDLGYVDEDGWLFLVDRRTDMILSGGVNVYPAEVEARLTEHPAVLDVAVVGVPDEQWGQRVVAAVVPKDETRPSLELADELIAHCRQALAKFKCPSEVLFRESLPRLPSGKLQRRLLRDELASVSTTTA